MASKAKKEEKPAAQKPKDDYQSKIVNPVLVTVGKPAQSHQTPVYAWQIEGEEGKQLMRQDSPELPLNFTGKNTPLLQSMYEYTIVPSDKIKKRMDFFYTPYNQQFQLRKHMTFDDQLPDQVVEEDPAHVVKVPMMVTSGLEDILERIEAEKKKKDETEMAHQLLKELKHAPPVAVANE